MRRKWTKLDPWDSRYYYPATPRVSCPRAWTVSPEYAVELAEVPDGFRLYAFVAQPTGSEHWDDDVDRLNPEATRQFLERTHEQYRTVLGGRLGRQVQAIFTDEPKYGFGFPWTRDMGASFRQQYGYDLPPRMWQLFSQTTDAESLQTRLHVRQWLGDRFRRAWLEPVSDWCTRNRLALVGHISPEDDPVQQSQCVSNLFPCFPYFAVPGFDLIIPRVGDRAHPLLNLGVVSAASAAQQLGRPGVLSESLACSGLDFSVAEAGRILRWQLLMSLVLHARTVHKLRTAQSAGLTVVRAGQSPRWQQTDRGVEPLELDWCPRRDPGAAVAGLPRLVRLESDGTDIRCTAWRHGSATTRLLMNLNPRPVSCRVDGRELTLDPGRLYKL